MKRLLQLSLLITSIIALVISCAKEEPTPEPIKYTLTVTAGDGGDISSTGGSYTAGSEVTITATPNSEYVFSGWSNGSTDNPIKITVNSNQTLTANFTKRKYALSITIEGEGTVTEEVISSGKDYDSGTVVRLTAVPSEGWEFNGWTGTIESTEISIDLTISEAKSIQARFIESLNQLLFNFYDDGPNNYYHPEALGYINQNGNEYLLIPFAQLNSETSMYPDILDYLRVFKIDTENGFLEDVTHTIYDVIPTVGFPKELLIEDFNLDGYKDFLLVDHGQENESIEGSFEGSYLKFYYGSEDGFKIQNFSGITDLKLFYHHAYTADYDNDGDIDVLSQRWSSISNDNIPNSMDLLKNDDGVFTKISLDDNLSSVGSVMFTNLDNDSELEALAATYSWDKGELWYWDIGDNQTHFINQQLGAYQIHDMDQIQIGDSKIIFFFPENYNDDAPILYSNDNGVSVDHLPIGMGNIGRDIIVDDFNNDGYDDFYMFCGIDREENNSFKNSIFINNGDNTFRFPTSIINQIGNEIGDNVSFNFYPTKPVENGYEFIEFQNQGAYSPRTSVKIHQVIIN